MRLVLFHQIPYNIETSKRDLSIISLKWARMA